MADFWIVLGYEAGKKPLKHKTQVKAEAERDRLAGLNGGKTFRVYRCKTHTTPSDRYERMRALLQDIAPGELAMIEADADHSVETHSDVGSDTSAASFKTHQGERPKNGR